MGAARGGLGCEERGGSQQKRGSMPERRGNGEFGGIFGVIAFASQDVLPQLHLHETSRVDALKSRPSPTSIEVRRVQICRLTSNKSGNVQRHQSFAHFFFQQSLTFHLRRCLVWTRKLQRINKATRGNATYTNTGTVTHPRLANTPAICQMKCSTHFARVWTQRAGREGAM